MNMALIVNRKIQELWCESCARARGWEIAMRRCGLVDGADRANASDRELHAVNRVHSARARAIAVLCAENWLFRMQEDVAAAARIRATAGGCCG
jgi:hypothetical protein